ncbi:MAG: hypothetical protein JO016_08650 [Actinobacteria bacterium]|nr:hypothetical protein [Actinomycetota bacterium]
MRTAVVRVNLDPAGRLSVGDLERAIADLRARGIEVLAPVLEKVPAHAREIELIVPGDDPDALRKWAETTCGPLAADGEPQVSTPTFLSRGTDEDALGVVRGFGINAGLQRVYENDEEVAIFTVTRADIGHVGESRLHTALEAALNCEVRIVVA